MEKDWKEPGPGSAAPVDGAKEAGEAFYSLRTILGSISAVYENRRLVSLFKMPPYPRLQEGFPARIRIKNIFPRITALGALLAAQPGDRAEQGHRDELIRYAVIPPSRPGIEFLPASSKTLRDGCGWCWTRA